MNESFQTQPVGKPPFLRLFCGCAWPITLTAAALLPASLFASLPKTRNPGSQTPAVVTNAAPRLPKPISRITKPETKILNPASNQEPETKNQEPSWTPQPLSRYQGIIDRMPFGKPPPPPPTPPTPPAPTPSPTPPFVSQLVLCALNRTPHGGLMVGFIDNGAKPPRNFYLAKGETSETFTVVDADFEKETATIEKDGVRAYLKLGKGGTPVPTNPLPTVAAPAVPPPRLSEPVPRPIGTRPAWGGTNSLGNTLGSRLRSKMFDPANPDRWPVPGNVKALDNAINMGIKQDSYVERLKKRRDELLAKEAEAGATRTKDSAADERATAAFQNMLRKQNMDMIRRGEGSLGIQLTPEEDKQLQDEGVLPAK